MNTVWVSKVAAVLLLASALGGCSTFHYEYGGEIPQSDRPRLDITVGVSRFADKTEGKHYLMSYVSVMADPVGDLSKGETATGVYTVAVTDGGLTVRLHDLGGDDVNVAVIALEIMDASAH